MLVMEWVNLRHNMLYRNVNASPNYDANVNPKITIYALYPP